MTVLSNILSYNTAAETVSVTQKLVGIARDLLPTIILQNRFRVLC